MQLPGMLANRVAYLSKYGSDLTFCDFAFFFPPSVCGRGDARGGETMWRLCSALALLALCFRPCDSQTSEHGGFHFPTFDFVPRKKKCPLQPKQPHEVFLIHRIPGRRIFPLLATSQVNRHIADTHRSVSTAETRTSFARSWISWELPLNLGFPPPSLLCLLCVICLFLDQRCFVNCAVNCVKC